MVLRKAAWRSVGVLGMGFSFKELRRRIPGAALRGVLPDLCSDSSDHAIVNHISNLLPATSPVGGATSLG